MGNGIVVPENIKESVAKSLKQEHDRLVADGVEQSIIQTRLSELYTKSLNESNVVDSSPHSLLLSSSSSSSSNHETTPKKLSFEKDSVNNNSKDMKLSPTSNAKKSAVTPIRVGRANSLRVDSLSPKNNTNNFSFSPQHTDEKSLKSGNSNNNFNNNANNNGSSKYKSPKSARSSMIIMGNTSSSSSSSSSSSGNNTNNGKGFFIRNKSYQDSSLRRNKSFRILSKSNEEQGQKDDDDEEEEKKNIEEEEDKITAMLQLSPNTISQTIMADNWDSVTNQPFCNICKMAFKSTSFLDRHIKYSEVHQKTLEEIQYYNLDMNQIATDVNSSNHKVDPNSPSPSVGGSVSNTTNTTETKSPLSGHSSFRVNQAKPIDGIDYRLVYNGVKFYWRTQENIDFDIYYHIKYHIIEVIPYDPIKTKEFKRLYFNANTIYKLIESEVEEKVNQTIKDLSSDRFAVIPSRQTLYIEAQQHALVTYLLSRLQKTENQEISFVSNTNSTDMSPIVMTLPGLFMPVTVIRRRLTGTEEFKPLSTTDVLFIPSTSTSQSPLNHVSEESNKIKNTNTATAATTTTTTTTTTTNVLIPSSPTVMLKSSSSSTPMSPRNLITPRTSMVAKSTMNQTMNTVSMDINQGKAPSPVKAPMIITKEN